MCVYYNPSSFSGMPDCPAAPPKLPPKFSLASLLVSTFTSMPLLRLVGSYLSFAVSFTTLYSFLLSWGDPSREFGLWSPTP